jgi:DNA-binding beta-propeller fold protein YncE
VNRSLAVAAVSSLALVLAGCPGPATGPTGDPSGFDTSQAAAIAIGQPDLTTVAAPSTCGLATLADPAGAAAFDGTHLFVSDNDGSRLLAFDGVPSTSGASAAFTLGQALCLPPSTIDGGNLFFPEAVRVAGSTLVVADTWDNRVLLFTPVPAASGAVATVAVGKPDLVSFDPPGADCVADNLSNPGSAFVVEGKLIVADRDHHRVLAWNALPAASAAAADLVLGQLDQVAPYDHFTLCAPNDADGDGASDAASLGTMWSPGDVWSDGARLVVADTMNDRVLVWNAFPTESGTPADAAIDSATGADALFRPASVTSDGTNLFVADTGNNRVLVYPGFPTATTAVTATVVLGQADFAGTSQNAGGTASGRTLCAPTGLSLIGGDLFVADTCNQRVLVFRHQAP